MKTFIKLFFYCAISILCLNAIVPSGLAAQSQVVDAKGAVWTISNGQVLRDGEPVGHSSEVVALAYANGMVYQSNGSKSWWAWNGTTWMYSGNPAVPIAASPSGTTTPPATHIEDSYGAVWTLSNGVVLVNGQTAGDSKSVTQLLYLNGVIYQESNASNRLMWNGSSWTAVMPPVGNRKEQPAVPTNLSAIASSPSRINLTWNPSTDPPEAVLYNVFRGGTLIVSTKTTAFSDVGLKPSTKYTYSVSAVDSAGNVSGLSSPVSVTTQAGQPLAGSKLGVNIDWVNDWGDRALVFTDVMKIARGFATTTTFWDPVNHPAPLDAAGWPTTDFGVMFLSNGSDPLNRPLTATFPSMFGTYNLSFTGKASVSGGGCCQIQNLNYDEARNTTTAQVVVGPNDSQLALVFTNTQGGVQNLKLLRPGYPIGTSQVFTNQLLAAVAPFSTVRFMVPLLTNNSPVTSWSERTQPNTPSQAGPAGIAWEYVIQFANVSGKDIWINIPHRVNLTDTSANNYVTRLANLMKANLLPGIHVYVEYSNEVWNPTFSQFNANVASAVSEVNSGEDSTLDYDGKSSNQWYWSYRRTAHQILRISQLFANVFGTSAINGTIRPVLMSQFVQPALIEDSLIYIAKNFGPPRKFIYGIGGGPYFSPANSYVDANTLVASLRAGLHKDALPGFVSGQTYTGKANWSLPMPTYKTFADYYGLKSLAYEGGLSLGDGVGSSPIINERFRSDARNNQLIQQELADWYGCGNDLFVYYSLATGPGDYYGLYEDLTLPNPRTAAISTVAATPLEKYKSCSIQAAGSQPVQ